MESTTDLLSIGMALLIVVLPLMLARWLVLRRKPPTDEPNE